MIEYSTLRILKNSRLEENIYSLKFICKDLKNIKAGQFILLDCVTKKIRENFNTVILLKRPFSIYQANNVDYKYEIVYKVNGSGTDSLSNLVYGDECYFLGPLGKPVNMELNNKNIILIAGGMGIAPLHFLTQDLVTKKYNVKVLFGVSKYESFARKCVNDLSNLISFDNVFVVSENKEAENFIFHGNVINLFKNMDYSNNIIFACGPEIMMKKIHELCVDSGIICYVFTERRMACGIGVCHSCNINGYMVCKNGPCFRSTEVFE